MTEAPWLTIVGIGEEGALGLGASARAALDAAHIVMGARRHLDLLPELAAEQIAWPIPFADGLSQLKSYRGRPTVALASGDPFWFGAGKSIAKQFERFEWQAIPAASSFSLAAARLGWAIENVTCLACHAAPFDRLCPQLARGRRLLVTLRDAASPPALAHWLSEQGFGTSTLYLLEALGGPRERVTRHLAQNLEESDFAHPILAAIEIDGDGAVLPKNSGIEDRWFDTDGQITKRPIRALTLSALAPRAFERLWDIGAGSGSIAIEWLLADPTTQAVAIEANDMRAARIERNAAKLGQDRLQIVHGAAPQALDGLPPPDAVFVGGGLSQDMLTDLFARLAPGTRLVANAVTAESQALVTQWHGEMGGDILRIDLAALSPLGSKHVFQPAFPQLQWSVVR